MSAEKFWPFPEEAKNLTEEQKAEELLRSLEDQKAFPEEEKTQEEKEQAEEMLVTAINELGGKIRPRYREIEAHEFEDWFRQIRKNVAAKFPNLEVVMTRNLYDALDQASVLYHISNGSEMNEYSVGSVLKEILEIRTPKETMER